MCPACTAWLICPEGRRSAQRAAVIPRYLSDRIRAPLLASTMEMAGYGRARPSLATQSRRGAPGRSMRPRAPAPFPMRRFKPNSLHTAQRTTRRWDQGWSSARLTCDTKVAANAMMNGVVSRHSQTRPADKFLSPPPSKAPSSTAARGLRP